MTRKIVIDLDTLQFGPCEPHRRYLQSHCTFCGALHFGKDLIAAKLCVIDEEKEEILWVNFCKEECKQNFLTHPNVMETSVHLVKQALAMKRLMLDSVKEDPTKQN